MAIEGKNIGFLNQMQYKVIEINPELEFVFCIVLYARNFWLSQS